MIDERSAEYLASTAAPIGGGHLCDFIVEPYQSSVMHVQKFDCEGMGEKSLDFSSFPIICDDELPNVE